MFRRNETHPQHELFGAKALLGETKREKLKASEEAAFYELIFRQIPEQEFAILYSKTDSHPNAPVNTLVAALILKHRHGWSYQELFDHIDFDLKTHIQRADSFLAASNIRDYSRLQLIIEVLQRFVRVLSEAEQAGLRAPAERYLKQPSGQYLYRLDPEAIGGELTRLGAVYQQLLTGFVNSYGGTEAYRILECVYSEHFSEPEGQVKLRPAEQLHSAGACNPRMIHRPPSAARGAKPAKDR